MAEDHVAVFRRRDGALPVRVRKSDTPYIEISESALGDRDGNRNPSQGDTVQIVVDSRARHRAVVPHGEEATYKLRDREIVGERVTPDGRGGYTRRYITREKG